MDSRYINKTFLRSSHLQIYYKIEVIKILQNSHENTCAGVSGLQVYQKLTERLIFPCEFFQNF